MIEWETENAKYKFYGTIHVFPSSAKGLENIDALVLEGNFSYFESNLKKLNNETSLLDNFLGYFYLDQLSFLDIAARKEIPIFLTDMNNEIVSFLDEFKEGYLLFALSALYRETENISRRRFLKILGALLTLPIGAKVSLLISENKISKKATDVIEYTNPYVLVFRNTINTEKIEGFVAPYIRRKIGKKPEIALVFGQAHITMEKYFKNKELRRKTLEILYPYFGNLTPNISEIKEIRLKYKEEKGYYIDRLNSYQYDLSSF